MIEFPLWTWTTSAVSVGHTYPFLCGIGGMSHIAGVPMRITESLYRKGSVHPSGGKANIWHGGVLTKASKIPRKQQD